MIGPLELQGGITTVIKNYKESNIATLYNGDCLKLLKKHFSNSSL